MENAKYAEFLQKEVEFDKYLKNRDVFTLAFNHQDEFNIFLKKMHKKDMKAYKLANPRQPKKRGGHDKTKHPNGQYWGVKGKPVDAADCIARLNDPAEKPRKHVAFINLLKKAYANQPEAIAWAATQAPTPVAAPLVAPPPVAVQVHAEPLAATPSTPPTFAPVVLAAPAVVPPAVVPPAVVPPAPVATPAPVVAPPEATPSPAHVVAAAPEIVPVAVQTPEVAPTVAISTHGTTSPHGTWGNAGPPANVDEALERRRKHGLPERVKKMLDNKISEFVRLGQVPRSDNTRGFAKFAATSFRQEGAGDSNESPIPQVKP